MFSPKEQKILEVLGNKKLTIGELTNKIDNEPTINGRNVIASAINRIVKKCEFHQLKWTLASEGGGRGGKTVWKTKR